VSEQDVYQNDRLKEEHVDVNWTEGTILCIRGVISVITGKGGFLIRSASSYKQRDEFHLSLLSLNQLAAIPVHT
jgi:hypothetical protein